jgi:hypothetical protein
VGTVAIASGWPPPRWVVLGSRRSWLAFTSGLAEDDGSYTTGNIYGAGSGPRALKYFENESRCKSDVAEFV